MEISDVKWGQYLDYEGPWILGSSRYIAPKEMTTADVALSVITATESGHFDAVNMYDRMIVSVGLIQFGEASQFSVSDLLGAIGQKVKLTELQEPLAAAGADFYKNLQGKYRFHFTDLRGDVDRLQEQQQLFLLNSNGHKGSWDDASKLYAKKWAVALSSILSHSVAQQIQVDFTLKRLMGFVMPDALALVFGASSGVPISAPKDPWEAALRMAYLSFAANNPTIANNQVKTFFADARSQKSKDVCFGLLRQLTFGPKITIYPARYNAIRPVLEAIFKIDLPDFAAELEQWHIDNNIQPSDPSDWKLNTTLSIQEALIKLGYDLGPTKADGIWGTKTKDAVLAFQQTHHLEVDGFVGVETRKAMSAILYAQGKV